MASIDQARQQATALGGQIAPESRQWPSRGFVACDGHDPEGNVFQVREAAESTGRRIQSAGSHAHLDLAQVQPDHSAA